MTTRTPLATNLRDLLSLGALLSLAASGCGGETASPPRADGGADAPSSTTCTPARDAWMATVRPLVERQCGNCHGAMPNYGAPYSLLDYDSLLRPVNGARPVDRIVTRLMAGTMPPAGTPAPTDEAKRAIVDWASCGTQTPMPGTGLQSSAPVFMSPAQAPAGLESFELRANRFAVGENVQDLYQCFAFTVPVTADRFVRRFEMILDEARVVHHLVLLRDSRGTAPGDRFQCYSMPDGTDYLYAWAPGQDALQFPEGGLRVRPGERYIVQLHYNNGARVPGVMDNSGVRIHHAAPGGTEYGMVAIGPLGFSIPARSTGIAQSYCPTPTRTTMLAGMPHMHEIGTSFTEEVVRANNQRQPLIQLNNWRFETQLFYHLPVTLDPGDRIFTRGTFNNTRATATSSGVRTTDEMCFNFAYVTPPPGSRYCDAGNADIREVAYTPGMCALPDAPTTLPLATGRVTVGTAPTHTGGTLPEGRWELAETNLWVNTANLGIGMLDTDMSAMAGRGQAWLSGGRFTIDLNSVLHVALRGSTLTFDRAIPTSLGGTYEMMGTSLRVTPSCPSGMQPTTIGYSVEGESITISTAPINTSGIMITPRFVFRRAQ